MPFLDTEDFKLINMHYFDERKLIVRIVYKFIEILFGI